MKLNPTSRLIISLVIPQAAGALGAYATMPAIPGWYGSLARPKLAPPNWVFGPVWTALFLLMGIALFLVWNKGTKTKNAKIALALFFLQLGLNMMWSFLFFGLQNTGAAFVEILFLLASIIATMIAFSRVSKTAAWLLVPYVAWVSFATYLAYCFWALNP